MGWLDFYINYTLGIDVDESVDLYITVYSYKGTRYQITTTPTRPLYITLKYFNCRIRRTFPTAASSDGPHGAYVGGGPENGMHWEGC